MFALLPFLRSMSMHARVSLAVPPIPVEQYRTIRLNSNHACHDNATVDELKKANPAPMSWRSGLVVIREPPIVSWRRR
jgi:hypothetical protein